MCLALHHTIHIYYVTEPSLTQQHPEEGILIAIKILERNLLMTRDSNLGLTIPNQDLHSTLVTFCRETNLVER